MTRRPAPSSSSVFTSAADQRAPFRLHTIRARVVGLLLVPALSLTALWGFAAAATAATALRLDALQQLDGSVQDPLDSVIGALQQERTAVALVFADRTDSPDSSDSAAGNSNTNTNTSNNDTASASSSPATSAANHAFNTTDLASASLRSGMSAAAGAAAAFGSDLDARVNILISDVSSLSTLRGAVLNGRASWSAAFAQYDDTLADALAARTELARVQDTEGGGTGDASAVMSVAWSREMLARQQAVLTEDAAAVSGTTASGSRGLDPASYQDFASAVYAQRSYTANAALQIGGTTGSAFRTAVAAPAAQRLLGAQSTILAADPNTSAAASAYALTGPENEWRSLAPAMLSTLSQQLNAADSAQIAAVGSPITGALATGPGLAVVIGAIALMATVLISARIGRGLILELVGLRDQALDLADRRLPGAIRQLRAGEPVPLPETGPADVRGGELGQVESALFAVHRAAVQAAAERAALAGGVSKVFLNLARRSQVLLHRQLSLLDSMERRIEDPAALEDLFKLDHMATRMRRHAEGLIILSGAAPGRAWRHPVPLMDVVRAAVAEVEDFARVDVERMPRLSVDGGVVADLAHLVAELVENAASFSPPHARVRVHGDRVPTGYVIQVEDRGLGMGAQALAEANRRIAEARRDEMFEDERLGLFVVGRLVRKHGITVTLRPAAHGGTTAAVLVPDRLLAGADLALPPGTAIPAAAETTALPRGGRTPQESALVGASRAPGFAAPGGGTEAASVERRAPGGTSPGFDSGATPPSGPTSPSSSDFGSSPSFGSDFGSGSGDFGHDLEDAFAGGETQYPSPILPDPVREAGVFGMTSQSPSPAAAASASMLPAMPGLAPAQPIAPSQPRPQPAPSRPEPPTSPEPGAWNPDSDTARPSSGSPDLATQAPYSPGAPTTTGSTPDATRPRPEPPRPATPTDPAHLAARTAPSDPAPPAASADRAPTDATLTDPVALPRRVRQASLAAPLRRRPPGRVATPPDDDPATPRSPDQVRATMSAFQSGWSRGRGTPDRGEGPAPAMFSPESRGREDQQPGNAAPPTRSADPGPGTSPGTAPGTGPGTRAAPAPGADVPAADPNSHPGPAQEI